MPLKFKRMITVIFLMMISLFFERNIFATELEGFAIQAVKEKIQDYLECYKTSSDVTSYNQTSLIISFEEAHNKNIDRKKYVCEKIYPLCENLLHEFDRKRLQQIDYDFYNCIEKLYSYRFCDLDEKFNIFISLFDTNPLDLT